jgi:uncharacterized protein
MGPVRTESGPPGTPAPADSSAGGPRRAPRPFVVQVAGLRKVAGAARHEVRQGVIDGLGVVGVVVSEGSPVRADLELSSYPGGISAVGTFSAPWVGECRRCGGPVSGTVTAAVRERYAPDGSGDEDAYPLNGGELDLEPLARDAVLLELPLAPLCAEDCLGLCPQCGTNWNESTCGCAPAGDPRWSVLDSLRDP